MREMRSEEMVCLLLGPETDRDSVAAFLEQAGYKIQAFKNPAVFFEAVKDHKPFTVVLETSALKTKLSEWVSQLQEVSVSSSWITMAPMNQYPILASYQTRGLAEIVHTDAQFVKERLLWALDRELTKKSLKKNQALDFVDELPMKPASTMLSDSFERAFDLGTLIQLRMSDAQKRDRPLLLGILTLDDPDEIQSFWGADTWNQVQELLQNMAKDAWGVSNFITQDEKNYILINATTPEFLSDVQELQSQLQEQGRNRFGFRISISGGVCEAQVHALEAQEMRRKADEACRHVTSKGGGRVGIPRPLQAAGSAQGGRGGDLPQNLG